MAQRAEGSAAQLPSGTRPAGAQALALVFGPNPETGEKRCSQTQEVGGGY